MADTDIQGTVTDQSGNPVSGAVVELTLADADASTTEQTVIRTTTDSNGNYIFDQGSHPDASSSTDEWHVSAYYWDGSAWVPAVNRPGVVADLQSDIPDSVVSRPADDDSGTGSQNEGLKFSVSQDWVDFQAQISSNSETASDETAVIERASDNVQVASLDISSNGPNDVVTFNDINLSSGTSYYIYGQTSNSRVRGFNTSPSFPYASSDGNLTVDVGYQDGSEFASFVWRFVTIGNINS